MIQDKATVEVGNVYGFKLITNEEIITKVISRERGEYKFSSPHTIVMSQNGAGLAPWPMVAKDGSDVSVPISNVVAVFQPRDDFVSAYEEMCSTIIMPKSQGVIT